MKLVKYFFAISFLQIIIGLALVIVTKVNTNEPSTVGSVLFMMGVSQVAGYAIFGDKEEF